MKLNQVFNPLFYLCLSSLTLLGLTSTANSQIVPILAQSFSSNPHLNELLIRGMEKGIKGNYQGAIADFSSVIQQNPKEVEAYYNRGIAYVKIRNNQRAIADFNYAISLNPQLAEAYLERAKVMLLLSNIPQAKTDLQIANELFQQQHNDIGSQKVQDLLKQLSIASDAIPPRID